jgi:hypothetical protein
LIQSWQEAAAAHSEEFDEYYKQGEDQTNELERFIVNVNPSFYRLLLERCRCDQGPGKCFPATTREIIIVDGMSVREFFLIQNDLVSKGYALRSLENSFSAVPSDTIPFVERLFGLSTAPSQLADRIKLGDSFVNYVHSGKARLPLKPDPPLVVWVPVPDDYLKSPRRIGMSALYKGTRDAVMEIIDKYRPREFLLTSDHGYLLNQFRWDLPGDVTDRYKDMFHGARCAPISLDLPEEIGTAFLTSNSSTLLMSRYDWKRSKREVGYHGGISLTESMVPLARFER